MVRRAGGNESLIAVVNTIWMRCPQSCYSEALDVKIRPRWQPHMAVSVLRAALLSLVPKFWLVF
jgi:hypothetical protein